MQGEGRQANEEQERGYGQVSRSEKKRSRRRRPRRTIAIMAAIIGLTAVSGIGTVTFARYVGGYESGWLQIKPNKFYFTSDLLKSKGNTTEVYNWDTSQDYLFFMDIRNWEDDYRVTAEAITYQVAVRAEGANGVTGEVKGVTAADGTYTMSGGHPATQKLVIKVPAGQKPSGNEVRVTVKAKPSNGKGYTKTLTGTFHLIEGVEELKRETEVNNVYVDLLIGVDKAQNVTVGWPSWLTPDNTNEWLVDAKNGSCQVTLEDQSSCRLRFFITGTEQAGDEFQVTDGGGKPHNIAVKQ